MLDRIASLMQGMDDEEIAQVIRLIEAKKETYQQPLAFLQAVMDFKAVEGLGEAYTYSMRVSDDLRNRYGIVHGGVLTTFIDTAMAETAFRLDGHLQKAVTLHLTVNFVKAAESGLLHCTVTSAQNSFRIALFHADVTDEAGDMVATADGHFYKTAHQLPVSAEPSA